MMLRYYTVEYKNFVTDEQWLPLKTEPGTGGMVEVLDTGANVPTRFYRIRVE